jgi:hypothetical protein
MTKYSLIALLMLIGCEGSAFAMSGFEKFAYEGCVTEGKYSKSICACNASNLNKTLSNEEKIDFKKTALGDTAAALKLLGITNKLLSAIQKCAE